MAETDAAVLRDVQDNRRARCDEAPHGYTDINGLQAELVGNSSVTSTVFVAWEHLKLRELVQNLMNADGGGAAVPAWASDDYDSLYVVRLTNIGGTIIATFQHDFEGLNGLSTRARSATD